MKKSSLPSPRASPDYRAFHKKEDQKPMQRENGEAENSDEDPIPEDFFVLSSGGKGRPVGSASLHN